MLFPPSLQLRTPTIARYTLAALLVAVAVQLCAAPRSADAAQATEPPSIPWSFDGPLGRFDRNALQRGLQVYREVCSVCHGIERVRFRNLEALGYSQPEIKAFAAEYQIEDGPDDKGENFQRPGRPADQFPSPFPNSKAAAYANNGAVPPDLSLIVKAREGGANYIHGLLVGFQEPPKDFDLLQGLHYNLYFPYHQIAMPPPLSEDAVSYADGTPATVTQMASDVVTFLAWAAEPHMEARKKMGLKVLLFLLVMTGVSWFAMKRCWDRLHRDQKNL